ncbi:hypothetical protein ACCI51_19015 [Microbulbifer echini]|uniref:Immunity protein 53 n=1 Tax=Microbulbifer echini TaxID=1529067 RepID=A0ABV4NUE2_9GAMM
MDSHQSYTICLPDWENVLPRLCSIIEAPYQTGDFESFEAEFVASEKNESIWLVTGRSGCKLSIRLEKYEGYQFGTLSGAGHKFFSGSFLLWESYLAQGGNPDAQEQPRK